MKRKLVALGVVAFMTLGMDVTAFANEAPERGQGRGAGRGCEQRVNNRVGDRAGRRARNFDCAGLGQDGLCPMYESGEVMRGEGFCFRVERFRD